MVTAAQICRYAAAVLYLSLGALGIWGSVNQLGVSETLGQQFQTAFQFAFGLLGLAAGAFLVLRTSIPAAIESGWAFTLALAGGIAAVAWGETPIPVGLAAGISSGVVALAIVWLGRSGRIGK